MTWTRSGIGVAALIAVGIGAVVVVASLSRGGTSTLPLTPTTPTSVAATAGAAADAPVFSGPGVGPMPQPVAGVPWYQRIGASSAELTQALAAAKSAEVVPHEVVSFAEHVAGGPVGEITPVDGAYLVEPAGRGQEFWVVDESAPDSARRSWSYEYDGGSAYAKARDAAMWLLWEHFGRRSLTYTETAKPSWVIGTVDTERAGVLLGNWDLGGDGEDPAFPDAVASLRVRIGVVFAGKELERAIVLAQ